MRAFMCAYVRACAFVTDYYCYTDIAQRDAIMSQ